MKILTIITLLVIAPLMGMAQQKTNRLSKDESSKKTQDQRLVHETSRKQAKKRKDLSMKKRVKIDEKQDKKARKLKAPKQRKAVKRPH